MEALDKTQDQDSRFANVNGLRREASLEGELQAVRLAALDHVEDAVVVQEELKRERIRVVLIDLIAHNYEL